MNPRDIPEQWSRLDPVFIRGMQRSGTSILFRVLRAAQFIGFPEGHLWLELAETIARFHDGNYPRARVAKQPGFALGEGRHRVFEKYIAWAIDRYHRDLLGSETARWFDKSPGTYPVMVLPILMQLFPRSQTVFVYRNGIAVVNSGVQLWQSSRPDIFRQMCRGWTETMSIWRKLKGLLHGRYLELPQETIAHRPTEAAATLTEFLAIPQYRDQIAALFGSRRENSAFPDKPPGDYTYRIEWSDEQKEFFTAMCQEEMATWGYEIDFDHPAGPCSEAPLPSHAPLPDVDAYYTWLSSERRLSQVERERDELRALLEQVGRGRVMRILNKADELLRRLGLR